MISNGVDGPKPAAYELESKEALRRRFKALRRLVLPQERERASREIAETLLASVPWATVHALHIYRAVPSWGEVDTEPIVLGVRAAFPGVEIVYPGATRSEPLPEPKFDLIVVPILAFDSDRYRLGLGAGFYDRFLAGQLQALKFGLAYRWALYPQQLPREPHDIRLDRIFTDA